MTSTDKNMNFEKAYKRVQELKDIYKDCDDEDKLEEGRAEIRDMVADMVECNNAKYRVWDDYEVALDRGNEYLDIDHTIEDENVKVMIECMREQSLTHFTISSRWSSMVELAWLFQNEGCEVVGMTEVLGSKDIFTHEPERKPAFLFRVNKSK